METLDEVGYKFIQSYEGCVLTPYRDSGGTPTIGWGMTFYPNGNRVAMDDPTLTQAQADAMFVQLVQPYMKGVLGACTRPLSQNQLDALTSFAYNLGVGTFKQSTLAQHVNEGSVVEQDFTVYDHVGQQVSEGLLKRRQAEYQLFIKANISMDSNTTTTSTTLPQDVTQATPQVLSVSQVAVTFTTVVNGVITESARTIDVTVTPELCEALQKSSLVAPGWTITVVPAPTTVA